MLGQKELFYLLVSIKAVRVKILYDVAFLRRGAKKRLLASFANMALAPPLTNKTPHSFATLLISLAAS